MAKLIGRRQGLDQNKLKALEKILKEVGINQKLRINSGLRDHAEVMRIYNQRLKSSKYGNLAKTMKELPESSKKAIKERILRVADNSMKLKYPRNNWKSRELVKQLVKDGMSSAEAKKVSGHVGAIRTKFGGYQSGHLRGEKIDIDRKLLRRPEVIDKMVEKGYVILDEINDEVTGRGIFDISFPQPGRKGSYKRAANKKDLSGPEMQRDEYLDNQRGVVRKPFKQAFEEARAEGKKEFTWKGNRYSTIRKEDLVKEKDLRGPEMQRDQYLEDQDDDLTEEIVNIKEEAKKGIVRDPYYGSEVEMPQPEIEPEEMPLDSPEPFGIYAKGTEEFDIAEEQEKDKLMMAAHGGEVKHYEEGGEVYDIPEYLQRPEEDIVEEDFRIEEVVDQPEPEPDLSGPEFDRDQYLLEQKSTQELLDYGIPGEDRPLAVNRELIRRKKEAQSGFEVGKGPKLKEIAVEEKEEIVKVPKPEKAPEPPRLSKLDFLQIRQLKDEKELRKAEDEAIKQAQQMSTIDPKRFYKNQSTFDKIVSLVGLAAGAYGSYKYGSPNTFIQRLDKEVEKDIRAQALDAKLEQQKLAASNFKISVLAKRLARSTKDADKQQKFLDVARTYQTKAFGIVKKQIKKKKDMADLSQLNKRGITDEELAYLTVNFPKMKIEDTVIKGRDGLNYKVRGGVSRANKVKEYVSDAQSSLDGLNELLTYVDKITIFEQGALNPFAAMLSTDRAKADSLRDRLVGSLRIEFFGPGVMTDQERENAKKILGDPNAFWTTDVREKAKVRSLIMKLNYGVRNKLRQDGLALPLSPNDQRIKQILERRRLSDNAANRVKVIDGLIKSETDSIENGNRPGQFWDINEPLPI